MHRGGGLVMCLGDINRHVGRHIGGFDVVHGGYGVGQRNLEEKEIKHQCLKSGSILNV